jgi:hypothetical protein
MIDAFTTGGTSPPNTRTTTTRTMTKSTALALARRIVALQNDAAMHPLVAHCHLGLGKLSGRIGNQAKADEHLTTATAMYREMGMSFWLEKAEAELGPAPGNTS